MPVRFFALNIFIKQSEAKKKQKVLAIHQLLSAYAIKFYIYIYIFFLACYVSQENQQARERKESIIFILVYSL